MHAVLKLSVGVLALVIGSTPTTYAQEDSRAFAVAYIEVNPSATTRAVELLREQATASRAANGNLRYQILQRIGRPNHFAIIEGWASASAREANASARHTRRFRDGLEPLLYSPYDERPSAPIMGTASAGGDGEVYAVTHVDLIPTGLENGTALVQAMVEAERSQLGAIDIGIMVQNNRRNHFTLFETWASAEHRIANEAAPHKLHFRNELHALSGALYDERLYRRL